jgi:magnesium chelatase family protein
VPRVNANCAAPSWYDKLTDERLGERSAAIRGRVERAREVREICRLDETGRGLVRAAMQQMQMSARAFHRILKLARTVADLAGSERIETVHLAEAIQYRPRRME